VLCEEDLVRFRIERNLQALGFNVDRRAAIKLILDWGRGYAMHALEGWGDRSGVKLVAVTWNPCPEHMEDLRDLEPDGLLAGEFFLRQELAIGLAEVLSRVSRHERYHYTPGPRTMLSPDERSVLKYAARGWSNRRIGERVGIEEQTVRNRLASAYKKLDIHNHTQAALYYWHICRPPD
jgi:DNA-binding CsgD family transcriptional regulator